MRLPLRMKKAGKNVVPTLIMKKSWVSYRIVTFTEPMRSLTSQGQPPSKPNSTEGQKAKWTRSISPLAECERQM